MDTTNTTQTTTPMPPPEPMQQPVAAPQPSMPEHHGHGKKVFFIVFIGAFLIICLSILSLILFNKNQAVPVETATTQTPVTPSVEPTAMLSPTPEDSESTLDSLDTGNPESDLQEVQKDVNQL